MTPIEKDLARLIKSALAINDKLKLHTDHATFEGSTNDVEEFRDLVNNLFWKYDIEKIERT